MLKVMREGRPRAVRSRPGLVPSCVALLACLLASGGGCATEVNTLDEPLPSLEDGGSGGSAGSGGSSAPVGGKAPTAGSKASGGSGGSGGAGVNAFGGSANTGGKPQGGASGAGGAAAGASPGGAPQGGMAGAGGKGGTGGKGGASQGGAAGASGAGNGGSAGGGSNLACLDDWKGGACDTCSTQTQGDKLACVKILDCYAANACGPTTCGNNDDKCGANKIGQGTAGYPIAKQVYDCACQ